VEDSAVGEVVVEEEVHLQLQRRLKGN